MHVLRKRQFLSLLGFLFGLMVILSSGQALAQDESLILYLGRTDSNADGLIDTQDRIDLISSMNDAPYAVVSQPDTSVMQFDAASDRTRAVYTAQTPDGYVLDIVSLGNSAVLRVPLPDLVPVDVYDVASGIWLVALNPERIPVLRGFNPQTGAILGENTFRRPNTVVEVHSGGNYALAYHAEAGALSILRLPSLELAPFDLSGYTHLAPIWSPTQEQFFIGIKDPVNAVRDQGALIDVTVPSTRIVDLPSYPQDVTLRSSWSADGRYVAMNASTSSGASLPLQLIDNTTGALLSIESSLANLNPVSWSFYDSFMLAAGVDAGSDTVLSLYDMSTLQALDLSALAQLDVLAASWSPNAAVLGFIASSTVDGRYGVYTYSVINQQLSQLFSTDNLILNEAVLQWMPDGERIVFTAPSLDTVFSEFGTPVALYEFNLNTASLTRLSPESWIVLLTLQVQ